MNKESSTFKENREKLEVELPEVSRQEFLDAKGQGYVNLVALMISRTSRLVGDSEDVEDILHDSLIKGRKRIEEKKTDKDFPKPDSLSRYMLKTVNNSTMDYFRKLRRRERLEGVSSSLDKKEEDVASTEDPQESVKAIEMSEEIVKVLEKVIPETRRRQAWILYELHGYSYEEIANMQNVPLGTVRSGINRARAKIAHSLSLFEGFR